MYYSNFKPPLAVWPSCLFALAARAQTIQSDLWVVPNGGGADLSQTFQNGQELPLKWNQLEASQYLDTQNNLVDLWVTAWLPNTLTSFSQLLTGRPYACEDP